jgi:hypothetical protein
MQQHVTHTAARLHPDAIQLTATRKLGHDRDRLVRAGLRRVKLTEQPLSLRLHDEQVREIRAQVTKLLAKQGDRVARCVAGGACVTGLQRALRLSGTFQRQHQLR